VTCQYQFNHYTVFLAHWPANPLRSAAPGTKVDVEISLAVHMSDWDVAAHITSHAPQHTALTAQPAGPTPAAINSQQQHAGAAGQQQSPPGAVAAAGSSGRSDFGDSNGQGGNRNAASCMYSPFHVKAHLSKEH
jgi:hypothetical protein